MTRYLTIEEVIDLQRRIIEMAGGAHGIRDENTLDSAVAQPRMAFGGQDLYATIVEKAAAIAFSLVMNHPFVDGNKRIGHAAMEGFLVLNGYEINAGVEEQEQVFLELAGGTLERERFVQWVQTHTVPTQPEV